MELANEPAMTALPPLHRVGFTSARNLSRSSASAMSLEVLR